MVRPSQDVLDHFYGLAECDDAKRLKSVAVIVNNVKSQEESRDYCLERLVGGLCSSRAAARIGYATALTHSLAGGSPWTLKVVNEKIDKHLDLDDREMCSNNAIGKHLAYAALLDSGSFKKDVSAIIDKQLLLSDRFPFVGISVAAVIATALLQMSATEVKKHAWSSLKPALKGASVKPDVAYITILLRKHIPALLSESVSYISTDGKLKWKDIADTFLIDLLKGMDKGVAYLFIKQFMIAAREDQSFDVAFEKVLRWAQRDQNSSTEKLLRITELGLELAQTANEISTVISSDIVSRMAKLSKVKGNVTVKTHLTTVNSLATALAAKLKGLPEGTACGELYPILVSLEQCHLDAFVRARCILAILERMDAEHVTVFVTKCITSASSLRCLLAVFPQWPSSNHKAALNALRNIASERESTEEKKREREDVFAIFTQCIDSLFKIKVKGGQVATATLSTENEEMLLTMAKKKEEGWKNAEKTIRGLGGELGRSVLVLYSCLSLWMKCSMQEDDQKAYGEIRKELVEIARKGDNEQSLLLLLRVLLDVLVSLLGYARRFHRTLVCFVFSAMLSKATDQWAEHLVNVLTSSDAVLAGDEGDEDGEDEDEKENEEEEEEESEEEEGDESEDDTDAGEVDVELEEKLRKVLGKVAATEDDGEESEEDYGIQWQVVDDEVMFKLDEGLVAAFKSMGGGHSRDEAAARFAKPLRARVSDLLLFAVSSKQTPDTVKIAFILPLLRAVKVMVAERKNDDSTKKIIELLNIMAHLKKVSAEEERVLSIVAEIEKESLTATNPFLHDIMAAITGFLCSLVARPSLSAQAHAAFIGIFNRFVKQETNAIPAPLASAPIARCPAAFVKDTKMLVKVAFNEDVRIYRRTEALQCLLTLTRKDVLREVTESGKTAGKSLAPYAASAFDFSKIANADVKPRFMALLLKLLFQLAENEEAKAALAPSLLPVIESLLASETDVFKGSGPLAKCNQACVKFASRSTVSLVQGIRKRLE